MQSAGMCLLLPAGAATDPPNAGGSATVLSDLILRGAGQRNSRQLTDHLDTLGLQRSSSVGVHHLRLSCAAVAQRVLEGLPAYADILRRAALPEGEFIPARDLALQALASIEDEPRHKLLVKLRERHLGWPLGRPTIGLRQDLENMTVQICREDYARRFGPAGTILSIAGNVRFEPLRDLVEQLLGDWKGGADEPVCPSAPPGACHHERHTSEQTHIGIAYPALRETDDDYYAMRLAIEVLSGGMSGRLFTEIREKRALAYNVSAGYTSLKGCGAIMGYAGTSTDRAQATLDTFIAELLRLRQGVTADELERARTGLPKVPRDKTFDDPAVQEAVRLHQKAVCELVRVDGGFDWARRLLAVLSGWPEADAGWGLCAPKPRTARRGGVRGELWRGSPAESELGVARGGPCCLDLGS